MRPSLRERRWRVTALVLAGAICLALPAAALLGDPRQPALAWAAALLAPAPVAFSAWPRRREVREVGIGLDGIVRLRPTEGAGSPATAARPVFRAPWLITLSDGTIWIAIWPDSLPPDAFRRLWACVRWGRSSASPQAGSGRTGRHD